MSSRLVAPHPYGLYSQDEAPPPPQASPEHHALRNSRSSPNPAAPEHAMAPTAKLTPARATKHRRHFVFTDPVAFRFVLPDTRGEPRADTYRYLEDDSATVVVERHGRLQGYELYIVEQWACSRVHPTFIITTYTGDPNHSVLVGVLGVPTNEEEWSPRLRVYFKAVSQFHARPKETNLGMLMVTNLSSFPSALTVIPVPDGDVKKHRRDFIVNENLKRLGCSGRSGMSLSAPAGATQAKFMQLYKTGERIPLYDAVLELVKLSQVALMIFGKLEQEYADGMLCDVTEKAINDWWTEIGSEYYNIEPTDGILGPTTVAALLGMLMGARNRLNYVGAPVAKDAFDVFSLKRGIAYFQKSQKMERTRRLDRHTLNQLHKVTAKAAAGEGWAVPKAVKSTVAELGKGGEMVLGMVGRDKAGIGEIETLDIDRFVSLVHGERAKWLWYGKPRRGGAGDIRPNEDSANYTFSGDDRGGYMWSHHRNDSLSAEEDIDVRRKEKESPSDIYLGQPPDSATSVVDNTDSQLRKTVFKSVTGKMSDARSGLGRIKDAVGRRGHASRHSKDDGTDIEGRALGVDISQASSTTLAPSTGVPPSPKGITKSFTWKNAPMDYQNGHPKGKDHISRVISASRGRDSESPGDSRANLSESVSREQTPKDIEAEARWAAQVRDIRRSILVSEPSVGGSAYGDGDLEGPLLGAEREPHIYQALLRRRNSISAAAPSSEEGRNEAWWPRQMSFSSAEEAVLGWNPISAVDDGKGDGDTWAALQNQKSMAEGLKHLFEKVSDLRDRVGPWVEQKVGGIDALDDQASRDQEGFQSLYFQLTETYQAVKQSSQDVLGDERAHVTETVKEIEILGAKLEYEINELISKVQDVEDGVSQFSRQVSDLEMRAHELETHLNTESWAHWAVRSITGIGTGPNITRPRRQP